MDNYNYLRMRLFEIMRCDMGIMAERADFDDSLSGEASLLQELMTCDIDILMEYKSNYLDEE